MKRQKQTGTKKKSTASQLETQHETNLVYRTAQFEKRAKGRNILSIALDIHMTNMGSYERNIQEQQDDISCLQWVMLHWKQSDKVFDALVFSLIGYTIKEAGAEIICEHGAICLPKPEIE